MLDIREKALAISREFQFKEFDIVAIAPEGSAQNGELEACVNHLDKEFMDALAAGAHFDLELLPL